MTAETLGRVRRFARVWDLLGNSGNFAETLPLLWREQSPFWSLWQLTEWLHERLGRFGGIPLVKLAELLFEYLTTQRGYPVEQIGSILLVDYQRGGRSDVPLFLRQVVQPADNRSRREEVLSARRLPRQSRHVVMTPEPK